MTDIASIELAASRLAKASSVSCLTGAGISAPSGVPTFRGEKGLWKQYRSEELATPEAFERDPKLVWEWYDWRRKLIAECKPNSGHTVLADWSRRFKKFQLITQNVDGPEGHEIEDRRGSREEIDHHFVRSLRHHREYQQHRGPGSLAQQGIVGCFVYRVQAGEAVKEHAVAGHGLPASGLAQNLRAYITEGIEHHGDGNQEK